MSPALVQESFFQKPSKLYEWMYELQFLDYLRPTKVSYFYWCLTIHEYRYYISYNKLGIKIFKFITAV